MLRSTFDTEVGGLGSRCHHQIIVFIGSYRSLYLFSVEINGLHRIQDYIHISSEKDLFQADLDAVFVYPVGGHFMKLCQHGVVGISVDNRNLYLFPLFKLFRQFFGCQDSCISCSDNYNFFHSLLLYLTNGLQNSLYC